MLPPPLTTKQTLLAAKHLGSPFSLLAILNMQRLFFSVYAIRPRQSSISHRITDHNTSCKFTCRVVTTIVTFVYNLELLCAGNKDGAT